MDDEVTFEITIPSDGDGFVLMQCEYCGVFFKCTPKDIESDEVLYIHCPNCGLVSDSYITDDVRVLSDAMITNNANDLIYNFMKGLERKYSSNPLKFKAGKKPKQEYEISIHSSIDDLIEKDYACCNRSAKINPLLKMTASHCPFCGVITFEDE